MGGIQHLQFNTCYQTFVNESLLKQLRLRSNLYSKFIVACGLLKFKHASFWKGGNTASQVEMDPIPAAQMDPIPAVEMDPIPEQEEQEREQKSLMTVENLQRFWGKKMWKRKGWGACFPQVELSNPNLSTEFIIVF